MSLSRRALLAAAAVSPFVSVANAQTRPDRKIGFAVAGLGGYATGQILPNLPTTKHCRVAALVTGDPQTKGARLAKEYGVPRENVVTYDRIGELAGREGVDVLYVITPTGLHMEHTLAGFDAGLHVLCEKPMATDVEQCDRMIAAGEEAGKLLMIGYRVHYEPHNLRAMELARGEYAPVRHVHGDIAYPMRGRPTWRNDPELAGRGGPLMDLGIYTVNAARYITGEEPAVVRGHTRRPEGDPLFPPGIESRCSWTFEFPSGATASGTTGYDLAGQNKYRVMGARRWFELEPATSYGGNRLFEQTRRGQRGPADDIEENNQFVAQMDHFAQCILEGKTPRTPGQEGRADVRAMRAIYESAESGSAVEL